jgi:hypothetical protein
VISPKQGKQTGGDERRARALVQERDGGVCVRCRRQGLHVNWDHRLNRSQSGRWAASNGQLLCGSGTTGCHGEITGNPHAAIVQGWAVPGWADPAEYPAARWVDTGFGTVRLGWVLYDDDGGWTEIEEHEAHLRMTGEWPAAAR